ncbi:exosortase A [Novosphingobium aquimarinum]|uniref:exosortase A n=1 Tax=Novosphingobium aquimarinum TaxID=2682494 RepID=UPI0012EB2451|nr:exosortase A [Novosphingobium aquimarinum]
MRPDLVMAPAAARARWSSLSPQWRAGIMRLALAWALLLAVFWSDWRAMAGQWWDSSTYNHVLLVPAILAWLVAQRWPDLVRLEPRTAMAALIPAGSAGFLWLLGSFSGLDLAKQAGVVGLAMAAVPLLLGARVTLGLLFPLAYMVFLVPFGDIMVPSLQMITAEITVWLVHLSGIAAQIDGVLIDTPAGLFEVAEACSGVKFLIAMIAFGVLAANVCFVSWSRRLLLVAACVVVPVLANGVRAWGTIFAAQHVGIEKAAGIDHIIYGWIFFALVLAIIIAGAWRFFDRPADASPIDPDAIRAVKLPRWLEGSNRGPIAALLALVALVAVLQAWSYGANRLEAPMPDQIDLPEVPGWHRVDYTPSAWWEPRATGADHRLLGRYADGKGHQVDVFLALYATQTEGREAGGFGEGALRPDTAWVWQAPGEPVDEAKSERIFHDGVGRSALTWFRTGETLTGSNMRLKLANMRDKLLLRAEPTTMLILSAETQRPAEGIAAVTRFREAVGPLGPWMDRVSGIE